MHRNIVSLNKRFTDSVTNCTTGSLKPLGASVKENQTDVKKERKTNKKK